MKLSTIWYKASRELTQTRGRLGDRSEKRACALGAIFYYDAIDKKDNNLTRYSLRDMRQRKTLIPAIKRFESEYGDIIILNDAKRWTFRDFARSARKLKL